MNKPKPKRWHTLCCRVMETIQVRMEMALYVFDWGMGIQGDEKKDKLEFIEVFIYETETILGLLTRLRDALKK